MGQMDGKRVIITGAGSGIGRASTLRFAREGAHVLAVDVNEQGLEETAALAAEGAGHVIITTADVGEEADVKAYVETCVDQLGGVDAVFANAGISGGMVPIFDIEVADWEKTLRINLIGPFLAVKHAAPHMIKQGSGAFVCTASVAGLRSGAGPVPYSASKAGVISLVQTVSYQLMGTGVRINAICPGLIETGMTKPIFDRARERGTVGKVGQLNPLKRNGVPDEIANMALFLASDEASYVNGQAFPVCGGLSASHPIVVPK